MDDKKSLKPELKEIYERVMNTSTTAQNITPVQPAPPLSTTPQPVVPTPETITQEAKQQISDQTPSVPPVAINVTPAGQTPTQTPPPPPTNIRSTGEFVFSSHGSKAEKKEEHKVVPQATTTATPPKESAHHTPSQTATSSKNFFNGKIMVLGVIFVFIWTFFWLIFFGIVTPTTLGFGG